MATDIVVVDVDVDVDVDVGGGNDSSRGRGSNMYDKILQTRLTASPQQGPFFFHNQQHPSQMIDPTSGFNTVAVVAGAGAVAKVWATTVLDHTNPQGAAIAKSVGGTGVATATPT